MGWEAAQPWRRVGGRQLVAQSWAHGTCGQLLVGTVGWLDRWVQVMDP
jgi:hypothetical protein